jgi:hypothetical protein
MKNVSALFLAYSISALACDGGMNITPSSKSFIPENSIYANDMTADKFKKTLKDFEQFFGPQIDEDHDQELIIFGSWASNSVNAFADKSPGKVMISIYGGLARHKAITSDGLVATLCHELGHHFGGYPKKFSNRWSSAEGQADYYATMKCLRRYWKNADNALALGGEKIPDLLKKECAETFSDEAGQSLCQRMGLAGRSVALMIQDLDHDSITPKFETPDPLVVRTINYMHPYAQCRLDTFFQGSICPVSADVEFDDKEEWPGTCHPKLGDTRGNRPRCWFVHR